MMTTEDTAAPQGSQEEKLKSVSAGVFESDVDALNNLVTETEYSRSMLVRFAIREFVQRFKSGDIELEAESDRSLVNIKPPAQAVSKTPRKKGKKLVDQGKKKKRRAQTKPGKGTKKKKGKKK